MKYSPIVRGRGKPRKTTDQTTRDLEVNRLSLDSICGRNL